MSLLKLLKISQYKKRDRKSLLKEREDYYKVPIDLSSKPFVLPINIMKKARDLKNVVTKHSILELHLYHVLDLHLVKKAWNIFSGL